MRTARGADGDSTVAAGEIMSIRSLDDLEDITRWLGTFRARLAATREAQRAEVAAAIDELENRYMRRRAELA